MPRKPGVAPGTTPIHRFKKGEPRPPNGGRKKGVPNKVPVAVKEFFRAMVEDPDVQDAFRAQVVGGDKGSMAAFLGAAAHVIGKPKETIQVSTTPSMAKLLVMALQAANEKKKPKVAS